MVMTESQKAFEANYIARDNGSGIMSPNHDDGTYFSNFEQEAWETWQAAEAYGRKEGLEDALAIVQNENKVGDIEFEIKELLK